MKYLLTVALFIGSLVFGQTEKLSEKEQTSLKIFLRVLTENSEAGYVLFDKKPVCIHGYFLKDPFRVNSENHQEAVALKRGALTWKKIKNENSDIVIHISEKEDPQIRGYAHVLVINKPLFHQAINENLSLFQYVLGPSITSQSLLEALLVENQPFHALLKYDKVLIGILLGFKTQNSLYGSRMENILETSDKENPPFLSINLINKNFDQEYLPLSPSFGFKTIRQEIDSYSEHLVVSSPNLQEKKPNFIFGWIKDDSKNKKFISDLEETQKNIQNLLSSENVEMKILEKIIGKNEFLNSKFLDFNANELLKFKNSKDEINKVMAKSLWEFLQHDEFEYLPYFIEGMVILT